MSKLPPDYDDPDFRALEAEYITRRTQAVDNDAAGAVEALRREGSIFDGADFTSLADQLTRRSRIHHARIEAEHYRVKPSEERPAPSPPSPLAAAEPTTLAPEIQEAFAMEWESAREADALGFYARLMCQVTLPHAKLKQNEFERRNGDVLIHMMSPAKVGLPYGTYPRMLMAWVTTEAMRTKSPRLLLGDSLSAFMKSLGLIPTGGRWGSIFRLQDHLRRLVSCSISYTYEGKGEWEMAAIHPVKAARLWWDPKRPELTDLWQSELVLSDDFYKEVVKHPVPYDERVLQKLAPKRSPLALDIYFWLTHRLSYLRKPVRIPWTYLQQQFGGDYKLTRQFKANFVRQMSVVLMYYPVRAEARPRELWLFPGKTSIPKLDQGPSAPRRGWV